MSQEAAESIINRALGMPAGIQRPEHFTNHTHCCECQDHDEELQPFTPTTLTREALGHMGWDPITFCTDEGFRYFLPGMIRILLTETGDQSYYEQFLFHLNYVSEDRDRYKICSEEERKIVTEALNWLLDNKSDEIEAELCSEDLLNAIARWSA